MKKIIRKILTKLTALFTISKIGSRIFQVLSSNSMDIIEKVNYNNIKLKLFGRPNPLMEKP